MNNLSWEIYAANVCQSLSFVSGVAGFVTIVGTGTTALMCAANGDTLPHWKALLCAGMAMILVTAILPSKDTVYAIVASEYGEKLLHTQTAGKAEKALDAWLDKQSGGSQ